MDEIENETIEEKVAEEEKKLRARAVVKRRSGSVRKKILSPVKQFPRAMVSFFKKFMILIRQAFKMMVGLEKENLGEGGLPEENVVQALIEKTRIWLVKQMGKRFPSGTGGNLLKHWKMVEPLFPGLFDRSKRKALSPPRASSPGPCSPPPSPKSPSV